MKTSTAARIENLEFLARWGTPLDEAARRAGFTNVAAAARAAHRHGSPVSAVLNRYAQQDRRAV